MHTQTIGLFKLTRVTDYFAQSFITTTMVGTFTGGVIDPFLFIYLLLTNLFITAFSFAINDLEDAPDDALDPHKRLRNPISARLITRHQGLIFTAFLGAVSMILVWPLGQLAIFIAAACLLLGFLYSYKPIRLKSIPIIDLASHGLFLGTSQIIITAIGFGVDFDLKLYSLAIIVFFSSVLSDLYSEIRDYQLDRRSNINNTASIINIKPIKNKTHYFHLIPTIAITLILLSNFHGQYRLALIIVSLLCTVYYLHAQEDTRRRIAHHYFKALLIIGSILLLTIHSLQNR